MATLNNVIANANGCVGIGTTSPATKLDVVGSAAISSTLTVTGTTALNGAVNLSTSGTPTITLGSASSYGVLTASGTNAASIYLNGANRTGFEAKLQFGAAEYQWFNGSLSSQIMMLNTTGLGIGTTSPTAKLEIYNGNFKISDGNRIIFSGASDPQIYGNSGVLTFRTNSTDKMFLDANGNVGIGTSSPAAKLHISGSSNDQLPQLIVHGVGAPANFNWAATFINSALSSGRNYISLIGQSLSTRNSGYIGFNHSGTDGSTSNFLTFGLYGVDNILNINGSGNVGIGTTSPAYKLDVNGTARIANDMLVTGTGRIGIGTTSPLAKLSIGNGSLADINLPVQISSAGTNTESYFGINKNGSYGLLVGYYEGSGLSGVGAYIRQVTSDPIHFLVNNNVTAMSMISSGNVGIGTTSPAYKLDVNGVGRFIGNVALITDASSNDYSLIGHYYSGSIKAFSGYSGGSAIYGGEAGIPTSFQAGGQSAIRILTNGNVGIGTTSPIAKLDINGVTNFAANVYHSVGGQKFFAGSGGTHAYFYTGTSVLNFVNSNDTSTLMTILNGGNVGIGTTSPAYVLDVNGSAHATSFPTSSDIRFKKNITPLKNPLEKVLALRGVQYEWNEFINSIRSGYDLNVPIVGMIAQEVEQIIPQIIGNWKLNDEIQDAKSLEYQRVVPYLVEAIKEQQKQIEQLKLDIKTLMNK